MKKIIFLSGASLGLIFLAYYLELFHPLLEKITVFKIKEVRIQAQWPLTQVNISKAMGKMEGINLLTLDVKKLIQKLKKESWVADVTVKKQFYDRLLLSVDSKKPRALFQKEGNVYFLDSQGNIIDKVNPRTLKAFDLPLLQVVEKNSPWTLSEGVRLLDRLIMRMSSLELSEVVLGPYPYFSVFLSSPRVEIRFHNENWMTQIALLDPLLSSPPAPLTAMQRIDLVHSKKAIVTSPISN